MKPGTLVRIGTDLWCPVCRRFIFWNPSGARSRRETLRAHLTTVHPR